MSHLSMGLARKALVLRMSEEMRCQLLDWDYGDRDYGAANPIAAFTICIADTRLPRDAPHAPV